VISYKPFWKTMEKKRFTTYTLRVKHDVGCSTVPRLQKNLPVSTFTLNKLCKILDCRIEDIIEYVPDKK